MLDVAVNSCIQTSGGPVTGLDRCSCSARAPPLPDLRQRLPRRPRSPLFSAALLLLVLPLLLRLRPYFCARSCCCSRGSGCRHLPSLGWRRLRRRRRRGLCRGSRRMEGSEGGSRGPCCLGPATGDEARAGDSKGGRPTDGLSRGRSPPLWLRSLVQSSGSLPGAAALPGWVLEAPCVGRLGERGKEAGQSAISLRRLRCQSPLRWG